MAKNHSQPQDLRADVGCCADRHRFRSEDDFAAIHDEPRFPGVLLQWSSQRQSSPSVQTTTTSLATLGNGASISEAPLTPPFLPKK
jgi:hypothetical protein